MYDPHNPTLAHGEASFPHPFLFEFMVLTVQLQEFAGLQSSPRTHCCIVDNKSLYLDITDAKTVRMSSLKFASLSVRPLLDVFNSIGSPTHLEKLTVSYQVDLRPRVRVGLPVHEGPARLHKCTSHLDVVVREVKEEHLETEERLAPCEQPELDHLANEATYLSYKEKHQFV